MNIRTRAALSLTLLNSLLIPCQLIPAQVAEPSPAVPSKAATTDAGGKVPKAPLTPAELEAKFKTTLTKATFAGRWCGIEGGKLMPEKEDKYSIVGVTRGEGDGWLIHSRIQYAGRDFVAPIPVQVKWAGDTAVITLDNISIPGSGSFTARVLIHEDTYAGSWSGGGHAGLLSGVITRSKKTTP